MKKKIDHIAIAVRNIDDSLPYYTERLGFKVIEDEHLPELGVRLAYLDCSNTMIQLVQPIGETPIRAFLDQHGEGLHHVCLGVDHIPQFLNEMKEGDVAIGIGGRQRRACFLTAQPNGVKMEVTENEPYQEN